MFAEAPPNTITSSSGMVEVQLMVLPSFGEIVTVAPPEFGNG